MKHLTIVVPDGQTIWKVSLVPIIYLQEPTSIGRKVPKNHCLISNWPVFQKKWNSMGTSSCLLDRKSCSTHWSVADNFKELFPKVNFQTDKLITDEDGVYTNGGAYSFLNLMIYLVEKYYDRQTSIRCSKAFQIEMDRESQSSFIIFKGQKMHEDEIVKEAQDYIEENVHEKISVRQLASRFAVSRRQFVRRFIKAPAILRLNTCNG